MKRIGYLICACMLVCLMVGCSTEQTTETSTAILPTTEAAVTEVQETERWNDMNVFPGQIFGIITESGEDTVQVYKDNDPVGVIVVRSEDPETLRAEMGGMGQVVLQQLKPFNGKPVGFIVTYRGNDYTFYCYDDPVIRNDPAYTDKISRAGQVKLPFAPTEQEEALIRYMTTPQYTQEQIEKWISDGFTLEQWAEKIAVPADAVQLLNALQYRQKEHQDNMTFDDHSNHLTWGGIWNAETVFKNRSGNCGGTSNIMNALLSGDFDQQGYVQFSSNNGGHIFNYFVSNGIYVMCDFIGIYDENTYYPAETNAYIVYTCTDPNNFGQWYCSEGIFAPEFFNPESESYLYQLIMYPRDGTLFPKAYDKSGKETLFGNHIWDVYPKQHQEDIIILYEHEDYPARFVNVPTVEKWPKEIR